MATPPHVALVTFDITAEGHRAVARSHAELIAGGLAVHLEARIEPEAGCSAAAPRLVRRPRDHHCAVAADRRHARAASAFAPAVFEAQCGDERCAIAVLPGAMVMRSPMPD